MRPHFIREAPGWQESLVTASCIVSGLFLLGLNLYEWGFDEGKKSQIAAFNCPQGKPGVLSKKVDTDGSVTCYYPQELPKPSKVEIQRRATYLKGAV